MVLYSDKFQSNLTFRICSVVKGKENTKVSLDSYLEKYDLEKYDSCDWEKLFYSFL